MKLNNIRNSSIFAFILGFAIFIRIPLVGELRAIEILALLMSPLLVNTLWNLHGSIKIIFLIMLSLVINQAVIDFFLVDEYTRTLKFISVYVFSILTTLLVVKVVKDKTQFAIYCFGGFLSALIFTEPEQIQSIFSENTNYFKQRYLSSLYYFVPLYFYFIWSVYKNRASIVGFEYIFLLLVMLLLLFMDVRSFGLMVMVAYALSLFLGSKKIRSINLLKIIFIIIPLVLYCGYLIYIFLVVNYDLGGLNAKSQLASMTNILNPFELLLIGRTSVYTAFQFATEKMLTGYGSYQGPVLLPYDYTTHSVIIGNYLYGGIIQLMLAVSIITYLVLCYLRILKMNLNSRLNVFLILYFILNFAWDYIYSPFGFLRLILPPVLLFLTILKNEKKDIIRLPS